MTTSYEESTEIESVGTQPNYNSAGHQVWNPEVGIYHAPAFGQRHSYGGIVGALEDIMVQNQVVPKNYPHNFAGIIAAIQDLTLAQNVPPVHPGPDPGNGNIIIDIDGKPEYDILYPMPDGSLWFDTRQGRLFVSLDDEWYQTNGADGLPIVTNTSARPGVEHPVPGQFWWDASANDLYIFDGIFSLDGGGFTDDPAAGGTAVWKLITDGLADAFQTTRTLPLGNLGGKLSREGAPGLQFYYITEPEPTEMSVQADYNLWLFDALKELDQGVYDRSFVTLGEVPPVDPRVGDFWYDTESLELSIWYEDDDSSQWVPTSVAYTFDDQVAPLEAKIATESRAREVAIHDLYEHITALESQDDSEVLGLRSDIQDVVNKVNQIPEYDLTPYQLASVGAVQFNQLSDKITALESEAPDYSLLMSRSEIEAEINTLTQSKASNTYVASVANSIPDISDLASQTDVATAIENITVDYLPRNGGVVNGSFIVNKTSYDEPAFDFSQESWSSVNALKFKTNSQAQETATFGTTGKAYEYAWNFSGHEDFCWVYNDSNKVFSITSEGPACSTLYFGDIVENDNNGRVIFNKIDVKERLNTYQTALEQVRQGVASSTDFDSLKANIISALANV